MVEKILNNTTPYGKIWASHEGSLHSSTLKELHKSSIIFQGVHRAPQTPLPIFTIISRPPTCKLICMFNMK